MTERPDPPGNGTADSRGNRAPEPSKPARSSSKPRPKPPATPKPAFVPVKVVFVPAEPGQAQHLLVTVKRHLDLNVRVESLYISQMMRDERDNPGYYGDGSWRRLQKPDAPELNSREFTSVVSMGPLPVPHNPVPGPPSRKFPVWLDFRWSVAQGGLNGPDSFLLHLHSGT